MGNTNCCDSKNIDLEKAKTSYPFAEDPPVDASLEKQKSETFKSQKDNSKPKTQSTTNSRDSFVVKNLYQQIEETALKSSSRRISLFERSDLGEVFNRFEPFFVRYIENENEQLVSLVEVPVLPKEINSTLKFYRVKLKEQFEAKLSKKELTSAFIANNKLRYLGTQKNGCMKGRCQIILGSKSFYEGKVKKNLPHGLGVMFYSFSVIYFGEFKKGKKSGRGVLEQRSVKVFIN